jgi:hypothetical protein
MFPTETPLKSERAFRVQKLFNVFGLSMTARVTSGDPPPPDIGGPLRSMEPFYPLVIVRHRSPPQRLPRRSVGLCVLLRFRIAETS